MSSDLTTCKFDADKLILKLRVTLAADKTAIDPVVRGVMDLVKQINCAAGKEDAIEVALTEALANAVVHGADADPTKITEDGWFRTGDVATIDPDGYVTIVDRTKDVIKSGGEWISTVELEGAVMAHPKVLEAAVIGLHHSRWQERPVAYVVPMPEYKGQVTAEEIREFLAGKVATWWLPDEIRFIDEIPKTSTLKFDKKALRNTAEPIAEDAVPSPAQGVSGKG